MAEPASLICTRDATSGEFTHTFILSLFLCHHRPALMCSDFFIKWVLPKLTSYQLSQLSTRECYFPNSAWKLSREKQITKGSVPTKKFLLHHKNYGEPRKVSKLETLFSVWSRKCKRVARVKAWR